MAEVKMQIGEPLFSHKGYTVNVGFAHDRDDVPHYLVLNKLYGVIEYSTMKLIEARAMCVLLAEQIEMQDAAISSGKLIAEIMSNEKDSENARKAWN